MLFFTLLFSLLFCTAANASPQLTLEEKVGQMLLVHVFGEAPNEDAKTLIQQAHVGGIIYFRFSNTLSSPEQVQGLSCGLQNLATIPLFIAIDQEGGPVTHLKQGCTYFPSNGAVARTHKPNYAAAIAYASSQELKALGINMNLAPVVDVNTSPLNPVIGIRSFGSSPEEVLAYGKQALKGYKKGGMIAALKHFPGHGAVSIDSHYGLPTVDRSLQELEQIELTPFKALAPLTPVILSAHVMVPVIDSVNCATFSSKILEGILRKQYKFDGVIMSDSLLMKGALSQAGTLEEAAVRAINAGCDMLCIAGGFSRESSIEAPAILNIHKHLVQSVKEGKISEERVNRSVERILKLKETYGVFQAKPPTPNEIKKYVHTPEHQALSSAIARKSVECVYNHLPKDFSFKNKTIGLIGPANMEIELSQVNLPNTLFVYKQLQPTAAEIDAAKEFTHSVDAVVIVTYNAWKFGQQADLVKALVQTNKPVIVLVAGAKLDADALAPCTALVAAFGPNPSSLNAALDLLDPQLENILLQK